MPYILVSRNALNCCTEKHCALQTGTCDEIVGTTVFSVCCFAWMAGGSLLTTNRILHWHNCMLQEHYLAILERIISIVCLDKSWWWNIFVLASGYSVAIIHWALNFPPQTKQFWPWSACSTRDFIGKWIPSRFQLQFFFCIVMYNWFLIFFKFNYILMYHYNDRKKPMPKNPNPCNVKYHLGLFDFFLTSLIRVLVTACLFFFFYLNELHGSLDTLSHYLSICIWYMFPFHGHKMSVPIILRGTQWGI